MRPLFLCPDTGFSVSFPFLSSWPGNEKPPGQGLAGRLCVVRINASGNDPDGSLDRFADAFVRLTDRFDRAVLVEEHLVHANGAASERTAFAVDAERGVVVEEEGASLEIDHSGVDGEAVPRGAGDLSSIGPGAGDLLGGGVGDDLVALRVLVVGFVAVGTGGVDAVVEAVALVEPGAFLVALHLQVGDLAVELEHVVFEIGRASCRERVYSGV